MNPWSAEADRRPSQNSYVGGTAANITLRAFDRFVVEAKNNHYQSPLGTGPLGARTGRRSLRPPVPQTQTPGFRRKREKNVP